MVRIKKLVLHGFKSFASKTVLLFPTNFTVICGPNGSGKSNILDAITFVLGRSSAKRLRADRMHEMIFHGSAKKKASEIATVSIYFDNSDGKIPLDKDEIVITRKVNKKGISIYKLNGETVTREKILEVLRPAGIHPEGHNIILQGDITEIIEMSPVERREIIDEISGIKEFDEKREKAMRELDKVEERLKEAKIVLGERFSILQKLEKEKEAAEKYTKLTEKIDILRASIVKKRLVEVEQAMNQLREKISEKENELKEIEKEFEEAEKEFEEIEKEYKKFEDEIFERSKKISIVREIERIKAEIEKRKQKIEYNKKEIERINDMISKLTSVFEIKDRAVESILNLKWTGIYGTVSQLIRFKPEHALAIEIAAGNHLNDIVVKDENVAAECIKYLKKNRIGRATFLPINRMKAKSLPEKPKVEGVIDFAINLIDFDEKYLPAISFVFGDTLVVENLEVVKKIGFGKFRYVTLEGDLVEKSSAMIGGFLKEKQSGVEEIKKYEEMKKFLENEISRLENEIEKLSIELRNFESIKIEEVEDIENVEKRRKELRERLEKAREKRRKAYDKRVSLQTTINRLNIQRARLEAELENIKMEFENYKNKETIEANVESLETELKKCIAELQALGAVNMKAVEEYEQQKGVYEELRKKVETLEREREKVMNMILEIEEKRKNVFYQTLERVREEFKKVFKELTGGDADLVLEEPENIESGLLIKASKGKKLINIDLLSGGEKTLTAIAFLFAIQRFKPAPFYILDEIDAALDKANTRKIVELLKKYSEKSQFIVISHNDITIQFADCVYGVSMEEGESKTVAIRMPEE